MLRALSTTACPLPAAPRALLERWRSIAGERVGAIALDPRLPPELQAELLPLCRAAGLRCPEVAHSHAGWSARRPASPLSADPGERSAAVEQIGATLRLAGDAGVRRVLLLPGRLPLSVGRDVLSRRFALGRDPELDELVEERGPLAGRALDHLSLVLDALLPVCSGLALSIVLPVPAAWPDQVPDHDEAARLIELFRGAPLGTCHATDWAAVAAVLRGAEPITAKAAPALACLRVADASGLLSRLAPGVGEVRFEQVLAGVKEIDHVLAPGPDVRADEVARAVDLLDEIPRAEGS